MCVWGGGGGGGGSAVAVEKRTSENVPQTFLKTILLVVWLRF